MPRTEGQPGPAQHGQRGAGRGHVDFGCHRRAFPGRRTQANGDHDDQQGQREHVGRRCAVAGGEVLERLLPDEVDDDRGRAERAALGRHVDQVEHLQRRDQLPQHQERRHRGDRGQRHVPEHAPRSGAVEPRGLDQRRRDVLQRGQVHHDAEAGAAPQRDPDEHQQRLRRVGQETLRRHAEVVQRRVGRAELRVEDEGEQHALGRRRQHERDEHERPVDADQADAPVQRLRQQESEQDAERDVEHRVQQGVPHGLGEVRVLGERGVVVQADPATRRHQVVGLEGQHQRPEHGHHAEPEDDEHGGGDVGPRGRGFAPPPVAYGCD